VARQVRIYRPLRADAAPPLVVVLHGASLTAEQTESYYHWDQTADAYGFVVAYPQGLENLWNAGSCCGDAPQRHIDDIGFVAAVIDTVSSAERIDTSRVYLTGVSNGAMLAYRFACERPGRLAALGIVAGTFTTPCPSPRPVALIEIHGLRDEAVRFNPGPGTSEAVDDLRVPAIEAIDTFRRANGCSTTAVLSEGPVHRSISACAPGFDVVVVTIEGAGHQWPGARIDAARLAIDGPENRPSTALDATATLWSFFAVHRLTVPA
jgi:polyhydroxybutyrate depolymerase